MRKILLIGALTSSMACGLISETGDDPLLPPQIEQEIRPHSDFIEALRPPVPKDPAEWTHFPAPHLEGKAKLALWATHYNVPRVNAVSVGAPLLAIDDTPLGPVLAPQDFCDAAMEGTVEVATRDGRRRIFSFEGVSEREEVDCEPYYPGFPALGRTRFHLASSRFGDGAHGVHLVPFRTIAVDPKFLAEGSLVYIPAARGALIPLANGETYVHDGYFFAADTGGAITGNHIDVFTGFSTLSPFRFVTSKPNDAFEAYVVDDPWVEEMLADAHWTPRAGKS